MESEKHSSIDNNKLLRSTGRKLKGVGVVLCIALLTFIFRQTNPDWFDSGFFPGLGDQVSLNDAASEENQVVNGIHTPSGLIANEGYEAVVNTCGSCHSYQLVTQNRATEEGWLHIIRWMQETQELWDLGTSEKVIVAYLGKNYGPDKKGRRENLKNIDWYDLEE